jgi:hypothetical protein
LTAQPPLVIAHLLATSSRAPRIGALISLVFNLHVTLI